MEKKSKRVITPFDKLTEKRKDKILNYLQVTGMAIAKAQFDLGVSASTINKIFEERFTKKEKSINNLLNEFKNLNDNDNNN